MHLDTFIVITNNKFPRFYLVIRQVHGRRLRVGLWGRSPNTFEMGDGTGSCPPNIFEKYTVIGCEAKYELTKKRCQGGFFLKSRFLVKKTLEKGRISDSRDRQKTDKR